MRAIHTYRGYSLENSRRANATPAPPCFLEGKMNTILLQVVQSSWSRRQKEPQPWSTWSGHFTVLATAIQRELLCSGLSLMKPALVCTDTFHQHTNHRDEKSNSAIQHVCIHTLQIPIMCQKNTVSALYTFFSLILKKQTYATGISSISLNMQCDTFSGNLLPAKSQPHAPQKSENLLFILVFKKNARIYAVKESLDPLHRVPQRPPSSTLMRSTPILLFSLSSLPSRPLSIFLNR